jgi:hypothetical protein
MPTTIETGAVDHPTRRNPHGPLRNVENVKEFVNQKTADHTPVFTGANMTGQFRAHHLSLAMYRSSFSVDRRSPVKVSP